MTREEHIKNLETIGCDGWTVTTEAYKSLQFAIKSLEYGEKVIEELEKELDDEVSKETITQVDEAYSYCRSDGIKDCLKIIKKHLGEVEE